MRDPLQLLEALDLSARAEPLADGRLVYDCIHLGTRDLPIGTLLALLADEPALEPPRTGHLGNWEEIAHGRAGALDFNHAICTGGWGYPLVYCFTQTEAEGSPRGDWVYLPGSLVERGRRTPLPLWTWDGRAFARRGRERALFCPFVQTEFEGALIPLTALHWRRMRGLPGFDFALEATVIAEHAGEVTAMLELLLARAAAADDSARAFADLIGHVVAKDGTVTRCELRPEGRGFRLNGCRYATARALAEHTLLPFRAVTEPEAIFATMEALPELLPVMAPLLVGVFSALFTTHYPALREGRARLTRPFNAHFHWGARDMAGYPPRRTGYLTARGATRGMRDICAALANSFPDVGPLCIVLLPASIFMLWPTSAHPRDAELLAELFGAVNALDDDSAPARADRDASVEALTQAWFGRHERSLSAYFVSRFAARSGMLHGAPVAAPTRPVEPDGFRALTMRQACAIVGALVASAQWVAA